jgi:hypothetical protein
MEARLYELIRDYQADRATALGGPIAEFRADALRHFALDRPDRYPEYILDDGRLAHAIGLARINGEILPPPSGHRDEPLTLRIDRDRAT